MGDAVVAQSGWRGAAHVKAEMSRRGFGVPNMAQQQIERLSIAANAPMPSIGLDVIWQELADEHVRNSFDLGVVRRTFSSSDPYRSRIIDEICADAPPDCLLKRYAVFKWSDVEGISPEMALSLHHDLMRLVGPEKSEEIRRKNLAHFRPYKEERLITAWYEFAKSEGWEKSNTKKIGLPVSVPICVKALTPNCVGYCGLEHSMTNLELGILHFFTGYVLEGRRVSANPELILRGMECYRRFSDGAEAVLGMGAYLAFAETVAAALD